MACTRDPTVRKQKFYNSAMEYLKKGNATRAELELRNALQIDPGYAEAASALAEVRFQHGGYQEAYMLLQQAVTSNPAYMAAHKGLAQLYRLGGKFPEAEAQAQYILQQSPDDPDALSILGACQKAQGKLADAEGTFNHVLEVHPNQVNALLALAAIKHAQNDIAGAERYLKLAKAKNPRSVPVYLTLIAFYIGIDRAEEAEPLFSEALEVSNNDTTVLQLQTDYYLGRKDLVKAEESARKIQSTHANNPKYWGVLGDFYVQVDDWQKAKVELERALHQHKDDAAILGKLIQVYLNLNDLRTAETLNEGILKKNPRDAHAHLVKGRLYLIGGDADKAVQEFSEAQHYLPDIAALYYWYARAYMMQGRLELAKQSLETAVKVNPNYRTARLQLAELQNQTGAPDAALSNARTALMRSPSDLRAMLIYSRALISKREFARAGRVVQLAASHDPNSPEVHRQLAVLDLVDHNIPAARKEFGEAWKLQPGSQSLLEEFLKTYVEAKQIDAAVDLLQKAIPDHPRDALLYHELAQLYLLQNKHKEAVGALEKAVLLAPNRNGSALLLADLYTEGQNSDAAVRLITESMRKNPKDMSVVLHGAMILAKLQRWEDARTAYERALQLDSNNAIAQNNLAWLLSEYGGDTDRALQLAQQAKEKLPGDLQVTDTIGWLYYKKGIYKTAVQYLQECADKDHANPTYQYQLGMVYLKLGDRDEARRHFLQALSLKPGASEAQTIYASMAQM
jgi:tetratricopeptide (TPR) repeat protein